MANVGTLTVQLQADMASLQSGLNQATSAIGGFERQISGIAGSVTGFLNKIPLIGTALGGAFAVGDIFEKFEAGERSVAKLESVIKSAGLAGTGATRQLTEFAKAVSQSTRFSGGDVRGAETMLVSMGLDPKTTQEAIRTATDLATVMGEDLPSAAMRIGRALQDPADGLTRLTREGVHFTAEQKNLISMLESTGQHARAQSVILEQLRKQFGGAAAADNNTFGGQIAQAGKALAALPVQVLKDTAHFFEMIGRGGIGAQAAFEQQARAMERMAEAQARAAKSAADLKEAQESAVAATIKLANAEADRLGKIAAANPSSRQQTDDILRLAESENAKRQAAMIKSQRGGEVGRGITWGFDETLAGFGSAIKRLQKLSKFFSANEAGEEYFAKRQHLESFADSVKGATDTPLEKFKQYAAEIKLALREDLIKPQTASRGIRAAYEELAKQTTPPAVHFGALEQGSTAAYTAAIENAEQRQDNPVLVEARKTVDELQKIGDSIKSLPDWLARLLPGSVSIP